MATGRRPWWRRWWTWPIGMLALLAALFTWNGLVLAHRQRPVGSAAWSAAPPPPPTQIKVLAWNLAKCFVYDHGRWFSPTDQVRDRLRAIAQRILDEQPDIVVLSEVVIECTPCDVDQVAFLRGATGLEHWAFGENYNFGLPFFRIVGGNAVLSRFPLRAMANPDLVGHRPFFLTRNSRRLLLCEVRIGDAPILLGALHTDSFALENNLRQMRQILDLVGDRSAILAGDFNAEPGTESIAAVLESGRFAGVAEGQATFPAHAPRRRIDYIFGPRDWRLVDHRVLDDRLSDHRPVVTVFAVR